MSENTDAAVTGPYEEFLTERLAALRREHPDRPLTLYRMQLIKALHEETRLSPREARETVDAFYDRNGLSIPQPSVAVSVAFGLLGALVLLVPLALVYFLLRHILSR
jgi:hypothetical protein